MVRSKTGRSDSTGGVEVLLGGKKLEEVDRLGLSEVCG